MATRKKKSVAGPSVVKGTHLTVITNEDGTTTLEWDDEQLLKEVREAIASVDAPVKKTVTKKKAK
jgi:YD repeat-containing protein